MPKYAEKTLDTKMYEIVLMFALKKFIEGFIWFAIIRLLFAMVTRSDVSWKGLLFFGTFGGLCITALNFYMVNKYG